MFISDRDFRKNKPSKESKKGGGNNSTDLVDKVRIEREQRQLQKEQSVKILTVQKVWRSYMVRKRLINTFTNEIDKKLTDIENVSVMLLSKKVIFCAPTNIIMELLLPLLYIPIKSTKCVERIIKFMSLLIIPSITQFDTSKNILLNLIGSRMCKYHTYLLPKLYRILLNSLHYTYTYKKDISYYKPLLHTLSYLLFSPSTLSLLNTTTSSSSSSLLSTTILTECPNEILGLYILTQESFLSIHGFHLIRILISSYSPSLLKTILSEDTQVIIPYFDQRKLDILCPMMDHLISLCLIWLENTKLTIEKNIILQFFCCEILTCPVLTLLLSETTLISLINHNAFMDILSYFNIRLEQSTLALPSSTHDVINSGQYLYGNIASLSLYLLTTSTSSAMRKDHNTSTIKQEFVSGKDKYINDDIFIQYIQVCYLLHTKYPLPGIFVGKNGVIWNKEGTNLTASGIPIHLQSQIITLLHPKVLKSWYSRVLLPIPSMIQSLSLSSDLTNIQTAMTSSSAVLVRDKFQEDQESNIWFTSKWASKLMSTVGKSIGLTSGSTATSNIKTSDANTTDTTVVRSDDYQLLTSNMYDTDINEDPNDSMHIDTYTVNPQLIHTLCTLWSCLFTQAVHAPLHSTPWKALSSFVFSTNVIEKLWLPIITLPFDDSAFTSITPNVGLVSKNTTKIKASTSNKITASNSTTASSSSSFLSFLSNPFGSSSSSSSGTKTTHNSTIMENTAASSGKYESYKNNENMSVMTTKTTYDTTSNLKTSPNSMKPIPSSSSTITRVDNQIQLEKYAQSWNPSPFSLNSSPNTANRNVYMILTTWISILRMTLIALDDSELLHQQKPVPLHQILRAIRIYKHLLYSTIQYDHTLLSESILNTNNTLTNNTDGIQGFNSSESITSSYLYYSMKVTSTVLNDLYARWSRKSFCLPDIWLIESTDSNMIKTELKNSSPFAVTLLRTMPWCISFHERMKLFRHILDDEKLSIQGPAYDTLSLFSTQPLPQRSKGVVLRIRRTRLVEDGIQGFDKVGLQIKDRFVIKYINELGEEEMGIDSGGLFKDFLTDLSSRVFNPSYGLFSITKDNLMYPNPSALKIYGEYEVINIYTFLGRVLGKALYENIAIQPQFTHFFLSFMHGKYDFIHLINDLNSLDSELYKNLMFLKTYEGDIADLCLTFTITDDSLGIHKEIELIPGGSTMAVTSYNKHRYINYIAKYYLYDRLKVSSRAFFNGLRQVIHPDLLSMFCAPELQILISGAHQCIQINDLKTYTQYSGGYTSFDRHITMFWNVLEEFNDQERAALLKFVTSCERPPSLGFGSLQPPFTIQRIDCRDDSRLPTASTCFNILKLPTYTSKQILKDKLLFSILSKSGFDLS